MSSYNLTCSTAPPHFSEPYPASLCGQTKSNFTVNHLLDMEGLHKTEPCHNMYGNNNNNSSPLSEASKGAIHPEPESPQSPGSEHGRSGSLGSPASSPVLPEQLSNQTTPSNNQGNLQ